MAKVRLPNQKKRYAALNRRLNRYVVLVQEIYDAFYSDAVNIAAFENYQEGLFRFADFPTAKYRMEQAIDAFRNNLLGVVYSGINSEWEESNLAQDLIADKVLKAYRDQRPNTQFYLPNTDAKEAFAKRRVKGLTLSQKIWKQSNEAKRQLEGAISAGIEKGVSAIELSKRVSKYLKDWDKLQKDYKEKFGKALDIQNCEYRSIRLVRSEINMAYRTAEQLRWQQMDFIKGYEIKTSGAHPKEDICDELKGVYPKTFHWTGWHPNCMCYEVPIVMSEEEYWSGEGEQIEELPNDLREWIENNKEEIAQAEERNTLPLWLSNNRKIIAQKRGSKD